MDTLIDFLMANGLVILTAVTSIIAGASVLANYTATDKDNKALAAIAKVVNFLALNFFRK